MSDSNVSYEEPENGEMVPPGIGTGIGRVSTGIGTAVRRVRTGAASAMGPAGSPMGTAVPGMGTAMGTAMRGMHPRARTRSMIRPQPPGWVSMSMENNKKMTDTANEILNDIESIETEDAFLQKYAFANIAPNLLDTTMYAFDLYLSNNQIDPPASIQWKLGIIGGIKGEYDRKKGEENKIRQINDIIKNIDMMQSIEEINDKYMNVKTPETHKLIISALRTYIKEFKVTSSNQWKLDHAKILLSFHENMLNTSESIKLIRNEFRVLDDLKSVVSDIHQGLIGYMAQSTNLLERIAMGRDMGKAPSTYSGEMRFGADNNGLNNAGYTAPIEGFAGSSMGAAMQRPIQTNIAVGGRRNRTLRKRKAAGKSRRGRRN